MPQLALIRKELKHGFDKLHNSVALDSGDSSSVSMACSHPVLRKHQEHLINNIDVSEELLTKVVSLEILTNNDKIRILKDESPLGRTKRLLLKIDDQVGNAVELFIVALKECEGRCNKSLGEALETEMPSEEDME